MEVYWQSQAPGFTSDGSHQIVLKLDVVSIGRDASFYVAGINLLCIVEIARLVHGNLPEIKRPQISCLKLDGHCSVSLLRLQSRSNYFRCVLLQGCRNGGKVLVFEIAL